LKITLPVYFKKFTKLFMAIGLDWHHHIFRISLPGVFVQEKTF
jgi:hypothetical protein